MREAATNQKAFRLVLDTGPVFAIKRQSQALAENESRALAALRPVTSAVPSFVARRGDVVLQQEVAGDALDSCLDWLSAGDAVDLAKQALLSLSTLHGHAIEQGLAADFKEIGLTRKWCEGLARLPDTLGQQCGVRPPQSDVVGIAERVRPARICFVKWDARPANALVDAMRNIVWIDWEHCGLRDPLDDVAWFAGDEFAPDLPMADMNGIVRHFGEVAADGRTDEARMQYFLRFGILHLCVRLSLILSARDRHGHWLDWNTCLKQHQVGATADAFRRLCRRGATWSAVSDDLQHLSGWFRNLEDWCPDE